MKIVDWKANGSSKFEGKTYYYYKATLSDGRTVDVEKNPEGRFYLGIGDSRSRRENSYASAVDAIKSGEEVEKKKVAFTLEYNPQTKECKVNGQYIYEDMSQTDYNRISKIVNGDSPNRAWKELKKFSFVKI